MNFDAESHKTFPYNWGRQLYETAANIVINYLCEEEQEHTLVLS